MAGVMRLILLFISFYSIFHPALSRKSSSNITWWCSKTPHPEPCVYYMRRSHQHFAPKHKSEFRQMVVQLAMERALNAKKHALKFRSSCETEHRKAAWSDCLKLYDNTVLQLNRTLQGIGANKSCTDFDAQTWLSAALTNIQTCGSGSMDLNVSDFINPIIMSNNLTQLLSNSLAINGVFVKQENTSYTGWFPSWLTRQERKLLQSSSLTFKAKANLVVAKDGSGNYKTIQAAINAAAKRKGTARFIIYVKKGVYNENIEVGLNNNNIMLIGDGMKYTIITSSRSVKGGYTTYSSATAGIDGPGFIAWEITFRNGAGPSKGQAVALRSASDLSVFYRCAIQGYQDTLMVHSQRQFYRECYIYGTIDFIFGNAAVVFQNSLIYVRRPLKGQANVITAQGRNDPYQNTAITIHNSKILAASDLKPVVKAFKTYLGRPWQQYSRTVIVKTYLDSLVSPLGWSPWALNSKFALDTLYYGEYKNSGPGSSTRSRVKWKGFHVMTSSATASRFTVGSLIAGRSWLPATGVPFTSGL
ncbi:probable pectinesterase/pectinesterase inhibitor 33 isoform X1 [Pistacia vera]|uniref:probable pectinesterase/pectinesterase inhibitor 33 isoform X1 n=1 Tax=Pistacia vera TaxID=55513 RepID=UPI001263E045|nr:probable pectinesterase/pectinesterase inhibitor 33 isoform X1 [Pistacia vera]